MDFLRELVHLLHDYLGECGRANEGLPGCRGFSTEAAMSCAKLGLYLFIRNHLRDPTPQAQTGDDFYHIEFTTCACVCEFISWESFRARFVRTTPFSPELLHVPTNVKREKREKIEDSSWNTPFVLMQHTLHCNFANKYRNTSPGNRLDVEQKVTCSGTLENELWNFVSRVYIFFLYDIFFENWFHSNTISRFCAKLVWNRRIRPYLIRAVTLFVLLCWIMSRSFRALLDLSIDLCSGTGFS